MMSSVVFYNIRQEDYKTPPHDIDDQWFFDKADALDLEETCEAIEDINDFLYLYNGIKLECMEKGISIHWAKEGQVLNFLKSHAYGILCARRKYLQAREQSEREKIQTTMGNDWECPICFDNDVKGIVVFKKCHAFHKQCLDKWKRTHDTCPVCRQ